MPRAPRGGRIRVPGVGREYLEGLFGAGSLHWAMYRFDGLLVMHFARPDYGGLFVSLDGDADPPLPTFIERCKAWNEGATADPAGE